MSQQCINARESEQQRTMEVRWSALRLRGADQSLASGNGSRQHCLAELIVSLRMFGEGAGRLDAWVEAERSRKILHADRPVRYVSRQRAGMTHIDAFRDGDGSNGRLLAVTFREEGDLLYAHSPIVAEAGWAGGSYDPPRVRSMLVHENAASA